MRRSAFDIVFGLLLAIVGAAVVLHAAAIVSGVVSSDIVRVFITVATFAFPLALIVIWLAEIRRVRGWVFWAAVGALLAGLAYALALYARGTTNYALLPVLASGVAAGLIYWSVAGRHAGTLVAAIDRESGLAAANDRSARGKCWMCAAAMLLVGVVPLALLGWQLADASGTTWHETLRQNAEQQGNRRLADAGLPWAQLKIENHVGRISGVAPTLADQQAVSAKAEAALADMIGLPGAVAYLQNDISVAAPAVETQTVIAPSPDAAHAAAEVARQRAAEESEERRKADEAAAQAKALAEQERAEEAKRQAAEAQRLAQVAEDRRKADEAAAKAKALAEQERAEEAKRQAAEAQRLAQAADDRRKADEAAAQAKALAEQERADEAKRLALEAEREKQAVAAARQAEADRADAEDKKDASRDLPKEQAPSNCDAKFADLFKTTTVQFERNGSAIDGSLSTFLNGAATLAKQCTDYTIDIAGHADRTGSKAVNLATSLARASAVRDALRALGLPSTQLNAIGYGDSRPLDPSRNRAAFERNRRVELSATRTLASSSPASNADVASQAKKPLPAPLTAKACHMQLSRAVAAASIRFSVKAARIGPAGTRSVGKIARLMARCPNHMLAINGHADRRGSIEDNRQLSERRADVVRDLLIQRGVDAGRLVAIGHGALKPFAKADTRRAYAQNRRVDFDVSATSPPLK